MKKLFLSIFAIALSATLFAQEETEVKSKIEKVTVFLQGAQITETGKANLEKGKHILKLTGLTPYIQENSIAVKTSSNITLINVLSQINYVQSTEAPKRLKQIDDSLQIFQDKLDLGSASIQVLEDEKSMIMANKSIKGNEALDIADLQEAAKYFREHLNEVAEKIQDGKIQLRSIRKNMDRLNNEKNTLNYSNNQQTGEILLEVFAAQSGNMNFEITYYTANATWTPTYDVRAKDINSPIALDYKANIHQTTGVDWKNVELILSTGNPSVSGQAQDIYKWTIDNVAYVENRKYKNANMAPTYGYAADSAPVAMEIQTLNGLSSNQKALSYNYNAATIQEAATTHQYLITTPYTILSDGKNHKVDVAQHSVAATYKYIAVPKSDPTAFLIAQITGWEKLNLLAGEASIFFEDAFVGNSYIDTDNANDTMDISLGRDKSIIISRTKATELSKKSVLGSDKSNEITWEIKVRNTKQKAITIIIKDQIPVSINKDIDVTMPDLKEGQLEAETGIIKWEYTINPGEEKLIRFGYKVKYPKKYIVILE
ncbi:MAG: DUF4139 domain-containing protein [Bacteroidetes bacterium]|nr:DUF4139 domain-containing protein [Bacteroidota bacterium]